jgi:hypothetical protein
MLFENSLSPFAITSRVAKVFAPDGTQSLHRRQKTGESCAVTCVPRPLELADEVGDDAIARTFKD